MYRVIATPPRRYESFASRSSRAVVAAELREVWRVRVRVRSSQTV